MITYDIYVKRMQAELKEINAENVVNWCKKQLQKSYNETKLHELEIARDIILNEKGGKNG